MNLGSIVRETARRFPTATAVIEAGQSVSYAELDRMADAAATRLAALGVGRGDRVGIWSHKSARTIAAMQAALRIGAAYVPCDPLSPPLRVRAMLEDCRVKALVAPEAWGKELLTGDLSSVGLLALNAISAETTWASEVQEMRNASEPPPSDELAYILYTSGSTGRPKGVCISHRNALAFIQWAASDVSASPSDRFANHAPFHFDLSVFDLYVAFSVGAAVAIVPEDAAYQPKRLVEFINQRRVSVWYSVPSALTLMMQQGDLFRADASSLRTVVFAGEPFPIKHLRELRRHWPHVRMHNYYGPTETNVCTAYEVRSISDDQDHPVPIGKAASSDRVRAVLVDGCEAKPDELGELLVSGPTVMLGYWGHPPHGERDYATGDLVRRDRDGNYIYCGRRDHMVKVRVHRVELGDVEAALMTHPAIREAVVLVDGEGSQARLVACVICNGEAPPLLELKRHCAERLPRYMIVDRVERIAELPRTRNGKVDRLSLAKVLSSRTVSHAST